MCAAGADRSSARRYRGREQSVRARDLSAVRIHFALTRPRRQDSFVERGVAFHENGEANLMQDGHDARGRLAQSQGAAGSVETQVVRQQHANGLGVQVADEFEVQDDLARHGLFVEGVEKGAELFDGIGVVELGDLRRDHQDILDDFVLDALFRRGFAGRIAGRRERDRLLAFAVIGMRDASFALQPAGNHFLDRAGLGLIAPGDQRADDRADLDAIAVPDLGLGVAKSSAAQHGAVGTSEVAKEDPTVAQLDCGVKLADHG